ncbi:MAG: lamin tail domain-containing protein, partial [Verrucomicrobiota bacterium]
MNPIPPSVFLQLHMMLLLLAGLPGLATGTDTVVTFNEIHYHPAEPGAPEWVELTNQMSIRVDLSGWRMTGGVDFVFPNGTVVPSKGHLVIQGTGPSIPRALGPFEGQLDNAGETLTLRDRNDRVMDRLSYDDDTPWPVGPDGSGRTLTKRRPSLATAEPSSWGTSLNKGGTPGGSNALIAATGDVILSEITEEMIEIHHRGSKNPVSLDDLFLGTGAPLGNGLLAPGGYHVIANDAISIGDPVFLTNAEGQLLDSGRILSKGQGRPEGQDVRWFFTEQTTPGAPNEIRLRDEIVISEIMYHFPPHYDRPETVENDYAEREEEWIELHNRSSEPVDLSEWQLAGGIRYEIPAGTMIDPGATIIVAGRAEALRQKYPAISILGDFGGKLSNRSDTLLLLDARGNEADRVRYYDSGRWPRWADGGGSSLELRDAWANNEVAEAWQASEPPTSEWSTITYEGRGSEPPGNNNPSHFHEFLMGLLGAGEAQITDVSVVEEPAGPAVELIRNNRFIRSIFTGNVPNWRMLGTHAKSRGDTDSEGEDLLRLIADGPIEHTYNNVSTTFPSGHTLSPARTYRISLRARWLRGSPLLNTRLYLNRLSRTHVLPIPEHLGSPGIGPSQNHGPTFKHLEVSPLTPAANEPIQITVQATDHDGVTKLTLHYRTNRESWTSTSMSENNRTWTGEIPGQPGTTLIQFYLEATDGRGNSSWFPSRGPESRALLRTGTASDREPTLNHLQLLLWPDEHDFMRRPEHAVSNARVGGTLIANEEDYHVDVGVRLRSSPYGRRSNRVGYNVALGKEHPYRGVHDSVAIDRGSVMPNGTSSGHFQVKVGAGVNELIINQIAQRAGGIPTTYEDVIFAQTPRVGESSLAQLRTARYGSSYLEGQYENGEEGATHKFELIYFPTNTVNGNPEAVKGPYSAVQGIDIQDMGPDKEAYRFNFIPTNNRDRDDFSGIIRMGEAFSARTDAERREKVPRAIDVDQWMRVFAFQSLIGVADTYNMGLAHNLVLYTRPSDGRVLAFPWDLDHGFYYTPTANPLGMGGTHLAR